ncbi:Uu.00g061720.m01.CDS01 [Anthostomella pinea]|uniref:Uu.00g061720.m01.CDS01 n=1 Tax=Anthostomella pinea TaxID=933095 RepID=A0AAI8VTN7_9PEZI|nr:Uu.00g061720.m01.CDS01 [Anthostomella pinea]
MSAHADADAAGLEQAARSQTGGGEDETTQTWFEHSTAKRIHTDTLIAQTLAKQYPNLDLVIAPPTNGLNLLAYANSGHASYDAVEETGTVFPSTLSWTMYAAPARRIDGSMGRLIEKLNFGKFVYKWKDEEFVLYMADCRDGTMSYPQQTNHYILTAKRQQAEALILEAGRWATELHGELFVFDQGGWQKNAELYRSVMKASWDNVILDADMKKAIIDDHLNFFESRKTYQRLQVPWKRGIIYYGPPGNGKTISIKAMMHTLYSRDEPVPTLYVRSLVSYAGPEYSLRIIFEKARQFAPCYLVFEDLDSIVSDNVRSYFLNEVDGLKNNDGIFMIGSTNHLDRLDPGISKRPSRFDRKYLFPDPNLGDRIAYCKFWQSKLADNDDIKFPDKLCTAIAEIMDKFSFAYMQEAFVAALLAIARETESTLPSKEVVTRDMDDGWLGVSLVDGDDGLNELVLWVEIKKQVEILREGMKEKRAAAMGRQKPNWGVSVKGSFTLKRG